MLTAGLTAGLVLAAILVAGLLFAGTWGRRDSAGSTDALAPAGNSRPTATAAPFSSPEQAAPMATATPLAAPIRYAAIGASDTVGVGTDNPAQENWTAQLASMLPPGTEYRRFARSGITLREALTNEIPSAIQYQPNLVTVWLVVNDAVRGVPAESYRATLRTALDRLTRETKAKILLLNAPDLSGILHPNADQQARAQVRGIAQGWNRLIAETAAPYGDRVVVVDLFEPSQDAPRHPEWVSPDGFHPSVIGYGALADVVYAAARDARLVP